MHEADWVIQNQFRQHWLVGMKTISKACPQDQGGRPLVYCHYVMVSLCFQVESCLSFQSGSSLMSSHSKCGLSFAPHYLGYCCHLRWICFFLFARLLPGNSWLAMRFSASLALFLWVVNWVCNYLISLLVWFRFILTFKFDYSPLCYY